MVVVEVANELTTMKSVACWESGASCSNCNQTLDGHPYNYTMVFPPIAREDLCEQPNPELYTMVYPPTASLTNRKPVTCTNLLLER